MISEPYRPESFYSCGILCALDSTDNAQEQQKIIRVIERGTILEGDNLFILDFQLRETAKTNKQTE
jgi:hypothetical protein